MFAVQTLERITNPRAVYIAIVEAIKVSGSFGSDGRGVLMGE